MKILNKNYTTDYRNEDVYVVKDDRSTLKRALKKHLSKVRRRISKNFIIEEVKYE